MTTGERVPRLVVAVDGGGEKTDVVAITTDGAVWARLSGPGSSPRVAGARRAAAVIAELVAHAVGEADAHGSQVGGDGPVAVHAFVSGLNLPRDTAELHRHLDLAFRTRPSTLSLENDLPALLRAGTAEPDAVAVVCGTGINAYGTRADGATVRFAGLGTISGDWGGGWELGQQALWHAARAQDGRGPATTLTGLIARAFAVDDLDAVIDGLDCGRIAHAELRRLAPVLLRAAEAGDTVAAALVDRQADEIVTLAVTALERLGLSGTMVPVVLGGGVITSGDRRLDHGIHAGLRARAPHARPTVPAAPAVAGAALLAAAAEGADGTALTLLRATLTVV